MNSKSVDVLIVGGGPAGLCAGMVAARNGLRSLVCEKKSFPVDKPCGEGIMPTGAALFRKLGILDGISGNDYSSIRGIQYISPSGRIATGIFREGHGIGITRLSLSRLLTKRAHAFPLLEICESSPVQSIVRKPEGIQAVFGDQVVQTRLLIGADGLNSSVRKWAEIPMIPAKYHRWGIRQHYACAPWNDLVEVFWGDGVEAYMTPSGHNEVGIAFLWDRDHLANFSRQGDLFEQFIQKFPFLQQRLEGISPMDSPMAVGPLQRSVTSPVSEGVILIGDAAGYIDAITGEGISLAAAEVFAFERLVVPLLSNHPEKSPTLDELQPYARAYQKIIQPYQKLTRFALFFRNKPQLIEKAIAILAIRPRLFQHLLSANMGSAPLWPGIKPFIIQ